MSEKVKALGKVLDVMSRKREGKEPPIATCPSCSEPLISTLKFPGAEFICVVCRRLWGFIDPTPAESTPELLTRLEELRAQWRAETRNETKG
jgi:hypothetical protein